MHTSNFQHHTAATVRAAFDTAMDRFNNSHAIRFLHSGEFSVAHYKSVLREFYHYTKEDPQMQALAAVYFRGSDRQMVKPFLRHAISEVGHDQYALDDLAALGGDIVEIPGQNPLPATIALTAFPFYQIQYQNPIGYLGYLYFLEHMPTLHGATYARALAVAGVPETAMGFLKEHMTVDMGHTRLMDQYLEVLVHDEADLAAVVYAIQVTAQLYAEMLWSAIGDADKTAAFGESWPELKRLRADRAAAPATEALETVP
ncbi:MAG: iron-containing redox enzyme family protein [Panacagrimonas sp.]